MQQRFDPRPLQVEVGVLILYEFEHCLAQKHLLCEADRNKCGLELERLNGDALTSSPAISNAPWSDWIKVRIRFLIRTSAPIPRGHILKSLLCVR